MILSDAKVFKTKIRQKLITSTSEENTYLASITPAKGDSYITTASGKAVLKIYDGSKWVEQDSGLTEEQVETAIESVRLQVTESTDGNLVVKSLGVSPVSYVNQIQTQAINLNAMPVATELPTDYIGNEILMFNKGICIGDDSTKGFDKYNYPLVLNKRGVEVTNAGIANVTAKQWKEQAQVNLSEYDFAIILLGETDSKNNVDINTFAASVGSILGTIKDKSIFICTIPNGDSSYNEIIRALVPAMKDSMNIHLIDLAQYSKCLPNTAYVNGHLTALGYTQMANEIYAMISYTINQNLDDFKNVQFSGTSYSI